MTNDEAHLKSFVTRGDLVKFYPQKSFRYNGTLRVIVDYLLEFLGGKDDNPHLKVLCLQLGLIKVGLTRKGKKVLYYGMKVR